MSNQEFFSSLQFRVNNDISSELIAEEILNREADFMVFGPAQYADQVAEYFNISRIKKVKMSGPEIKDEFCHFFKVLPKRKRRASKPRKVYNVDGVYCHKNGDFYKPVSPATLTKIMMAKL